MSFIDTRLSKQVEAGFSGGPMWDTSIVAMANGFENRNANWSLPHHKFTADYTILNPRDQNEILHAFMAARGRLNSFRFKDWNDFKIVNESLGVGDGTSTPRQLTKTYTFGPTTYTRTILLPVATSIQVTSNGVAKAVTVDDETGLITPTTAWANGQVLKVAYCEFDVKVCFGADYYPFTQRAVSVAQCTVELLEDMTP